MIYMDYNATTPCDNRVLEAMLPYFQEEFGNAASRSHAPGWRAESAVELARQSIANGIGVDPREIVFTSGATEAVNLAIKGVFEKYRKKGRHIITMSTEHNAVLDSCLHLEKIGGEITRLGADRNGLIDLEGLEAAIRDDTVLVSVMWANNETGVIQPMKEIGAICARHGVLLMTDATQALGKIPIRVRECGVHLAAFSAHKLYGPKGVGALFVNNRNPRVQLSAQMHGGGHEAGMRSGTLNVPGIVGFGKAVDIALEEMEQESVRLRKLRDKLEQKLLQQLEEVFINGDKHMRLPHVSNLSFSFVEAEVLMTRLNRYLCVSSGSACTSASLEPSHVLKAYGLSDGLASAGLRFSLGRMTTEEEVDQAVEMVIEGVLDLRSKSPLWSMFQKGVDLSDLY